MCYTKFIKLIFNIMASTKKKGVKKAPAKKKVAKKKVVSKSQKRRVASLKKPAMVNYTVTQEDLDTNPEFLEKGYKVGEVIQIPKPAGDFHIKVSMNDAIFEIDSDLIAEPMLSLKPDSLKTKVIINITHIPSKKSAEFVLFNMRAKRLFTLPLAAMAFEKNVKTSLNVKS